MRTLLCLKLCAAVATVITHSHASFAATGSVFLFGGSQHDGGNIAALFGGSTGSPYDGKHFSNGQTYGEYLPGILSMNYHSGNNFAYGGATSTNINLINLLTGSNSALGLSSQISKIETYRLHFSSSDLISINAAQNDFTAAALRGVTSVTGMVNVGAANAANLTTAVTRLTALGARRFVVATPSDYWLNPGHANLPQSVTAGVDEAIRLLTPNLQAVHNATGADIVIYNHKLAYQQFFANPSAYGFENVSIGCGTNGTCKDGAGSTYLFFDANHPTTYGHAVMAAQVANLINAPAQAASNLLLTQSATEAIDRALLSRLDAPLAAAGTLRAYALGLASFGRHGARTDSNGVTATFADSYSIAGGGFGVDYGVSDSVTVGAMIGRTAMNASADQGADIRGHATVLGLTTAWSEGGWQLDAAASYSFDKLSRISRPGVMLGDLSASTDGAGGSFSARASRMFDVDGVKVGPRVALSYRANRLDAYTEQGDPLLAHWVDSASRHVFSGSLGIKATLPEVSADLPLSLTGSLSVEHVFSGDGFRLNAAALSAPIIRTVQVPDASSTFGQATLTGTYRLNDRLFANASAQSTLWRKGDDQHHATLSLLFKL